jgi:hypothetical protein
MSIPVIYPGMSPTVLNDDHDTPSWLLGSLNQA